MKTYVVILQESLHGSPCGTTRDEVVAESADAAERRAVESWEGLRRHQGREGFSYGPLLTTEA